MALVTWLGLLAGTLTTIAYIPQAIKSWKTKETKDLSLIMFIVLDTGLALWLTYGIIIKNIPLIYANVTGFALVSSVLYLKIKYG